MQLLRFMTAGSVDDGKSTLIGRLFYETGNIHQDHLDSISKDGLNLAHFTDGLKEEREKGITIDVAYRYFETQNYKFIVADAPGHKEFTRNMITALTHSDAVLILADASRGITEQTKRHLFLSQWMETDNIVVLINKMDLVNYEEKIFQDFKKQLNINSNITFIPISALLGDNVLQKSKHMTWYHGPTVYEWLHTKTKKIENDKYTYFPVQMSKGNKVLGTLTKGRIQIGDKLLINDGSKHCTVLKISAWPKDLKLANAGEPIQLELDTPTMRGDILHSNFEELKAVNCFSAQWCYMLDTPISFKGNYLLKVGSKEIKIKTLTATKQYSIDTASWIEKQDSSMLMNTLYDGSINFSEKICLTPSTRFALIDYDSCKTIAAGKVLSY